MNATGSAFVPNQSLAELDRLWALYRAAEDRNRALEAHTAEQRAKRARYSRQRYARMKGELSMETAPIFQRRSPAAVQPTPPAPTSATQTPPRPAQPQLLPRPPQPPVPVPILPMMMPTVPMPAMNAGAGVIVPAVGVPVVMSPVAISQLYAHQQQQQQQPSSPPHRTQASNSPSSTTSSRPTLVPIVPAPSRSSSSSAGGPSAPPPPPPPPSSSTLSSSSSSSSRKKNTLRLPLEGNEDVYAELMVELVTECHVPLENCGEVIREFARLIEKREMPELNVHELLSRVEKGRELLGQREEEREVINVMERRGGVRVPYGRLTNGAMIEFLRKERKRNQAVRIGKKNRAELIATIRALASSEHQAESSG